MKVSVARWVCILSVAVVPPTWGQDVFSTLDDTRAAERRLLATNDDATTRSIDFNADGREDVADLVYSLISNPAIPADELPGSIDLRTATPVATAGGTLQLIWSIAGKVDPVNEEVLIRARLPGLPTSGTLTSTPSTAPPNGPVLYAGFGGAWSVTEPVFSLDGVSGSVTVALLPDFRGEWLFEGLLRERTGKRVISVDAERVLATTGTTIQLNLNRRIVSPLETVSASVRMTAGATPRNVRLDAWLATPAGEEIWLPSFSPRGRALYEGVSTDQTIEIFNRHFEDIGIGEYVLRTRLTESESTRILAAAEIPFAICDTIHQIAGVVYHGNPSSGVRINGGNFDAAAVEAIDLDSGARAGQASISAAGEYTLQLPAGRFALNGYLVNGFNRADAPLGEPLILACEDEPAIRDLSFATLPAPNRSTSVSKRSTAVLQQAPPSTLPAPAVFLDAVYVGEPGELSEQNVRLLAGAYANEMFNLAPDVNIIDYSTLEVMLNLSAGQVVSGTPEEQQIDIGEIAGALGTAQYLRFEVADRGPNSGTFRYRVSSCLINPTTVRRELCTERNIESIEQLITASSEVAQQQAVPLRETLAVLRETPVLPTLNLVLDRSAVRPGEQIAATVTLLDGDGSRIDDEIVEVLHVTGLSGGNIDETVLGITGSSGNGEARVTLNVPAAAEQGLAIARYKRGGKTWNSSDRYYAVIRQDADNAFLLAEPFPEILLKPGEQATVHFEVRGAPGANLAGIPISAQTDNGTVTPPTATTDVNGRVSFTFTAGNEFRRTSVVATYEENSGGGPVEQAAAYEFWVSGSLALNLNRGNTGGSANDIGLNQFTVQGGEFQIPVIASLSVDGNPVPYPVMFQLQGAGSLRPVGPTGDGLPQSQGDEAGRLRGVISATVFKPPRDRAGNATLIGLARFEGEEVTKNIEIAYDPVLALQAHTEGALTEDEPTLLVVRAGRVNQNASPTWGPGISIDIEAEGGTLDQSSGVTDAEGLFTTLAHLNEGSGAISMIIRGDAGDGSLATGVLIARKQLPSNFDTSLVLYLCQGSDCSGQTPRTLQHANAGTLADERVGPTLTVAGLSTPGELRLSGHHHNMGAQNQQGSLDGVAAFHDAVMIESPGKDGQGGEAFVQLDLTMRADVNVSYTGDPHPNNTQAGVSLETIFSMLAFGPSIQHSRTSSWAYRRDLGYRNTIEHPRQEIIPFNFRYGMPFRLQWSAQSRGGAPGVDIPAYTIQSAVDFNSVGTLKIIVLNDPAATITSDLGGSYN